MSHNIVHLDNLQYENKALLNGCRYVAGVDEAGRGALASAVVAAAVLLGDTAPLSEVTDSKLLTPSNRERLYLLIFQHSISVGIGASSAAYIDRHGIVPATMRAMRTAVMRLNPCPDYILVDGTLCPDNLPAPSEAVIRGDRLSLSIAAASIIAKVTRDRIMRNLDPIYPAFGFAAHKGYGTVKHLQLLNANEPTPHHRFSYAPVRQRRLDFDAQR